MFNRWMKELCRDQVVMGVQEDPGLVTVMGVEDDPGPVTDQDSNV